MVSFLFSYLWNSSNCLRLGFKIRFNSFPNDHSRYMLDCLQNYPSHICSVHSYRSRPLCFRRFDRGLKPTAQCWSKRHHQKVVSPMILVHLWYRGEHRLRAVADYCIRREGSISSGDSLRCCSIIRAVLSALFGEPRFPRRHGGSWPFYFH